MNEKKQGYMQQVDSWCLEEVLRPLFAAWRHLSALANEITPEDRDKIVGDAVACAQKAIRAKLLESYRNGQKACPKCNPKPKNGKQESSGADSAGSFDLLGGNR
jgi:hypothetical protein